MEFAPDRPGAAFDWPGEQAQVKSGNGRHRIAFDRLGMLTPERVEHHDGNGKLIGVASQAAVVYQCDECGALTAQTAMHEAWHRSLALPGSPGDET